MPDGFEAAKEKFISGELTVRKAAEMCGMNYVTFYNYIKNVLEGVKKVDFFKQW